MYSTVEAVLLCTKGNHVTSLCRVNLHLPILKENGHLVCYHQIDGLVEMWNIENMRNHHLFATCSDKGNAANTLNPN